MKKMALCMAWVLILGFVGTAFAAGKGLVGVQKWECSECKKEFFTVGNDDPMNDEPNKEHKNWLFKSTNPGSYIGDCPRAKQKNREHVFMKKGSVMQTRSYDFAKSFFGNGDKFIVLTGRGRVQIAEWKCDFCNKTFYSVKGDDLNKDYDRDIDYQRNHLFTLKDPGRAVETCNSSAFKSKTHLFTLKRDSISETSFQFARGYGDKLLVIK
ncbi:hypothetical protein LJC26_01635 [Desulfovibrio sp. OttesenSCG-928-O18]|nr:hypothetical protein [Desulfovibrio sp. OttesenSCG-928-O18]